jgi:hypothetical protein
VAVQVFSAEEEGWTVQGAEELLSSLTGVLSVRLVARPDGDIEEVHLLTSKEVSPKQTVRNVESALLAHYDLALDHRKISVAQTTNGGFDRGVARVLQDPAPAPARAPEAPSRILFVGHQVESERSHRVRMTVSLEWDGERFDGEASGADLPRAHLEALANATLQAIELTVTQKMMKENGSKTFALALDGVKVVDAFDRSFVLVSVHALQGRHILPLAGAASVEDSRERSVILATLQATDRWVRGRV